MTLGRPGEVPVQPFPAHHLAFWGGNGGRVCACEGQHLPGDQETPTLRSLVSEKPLLSGLALLKSTPVVLKPSYVPIQS